MTAQTIRRALNNMPTIETVQFGPVQVRLFKSVSVVRFECRFNGERVNYKYWRWEPSIDWQRYNRMEAHDDCVDEVIAFVLAHQDQEARAS